MCVSRLPSEKAYSAGRGENWDRTTASTSPRAHGTQKFGKERVHRKELCKSANLQIAIRLRQQSRTGHFRKLCHKNDAPAEKHGTWRTMSLSSKHKDEAPFDSPSEAWVMKAPSSKRPQTREFVIDWGASLHTLSNKDSSSGELETLRRSRNPTTVVTASGEVQTNEEAQVYVHDLGLFVTVHLLEDTRAVVSLGKLCEEHGYTHEWASGQRPHLTKDGKKILFKTEKFVPVVVPGLSSSSSASSFSAPLPQDSSSSSTPASLRSDDVYQHALGNRHDNPKTKHINQNEHNKQAAGNRVRDLPEWLQDFTDIL